MTSCIFLLLRCLNLVCNTINITNFVWILSVSFYCYPSLIDVLLHIVHSVNQSIQLKVLSHGPNIFCLLLLQVGYALALSWFLTNTFPFHLLELELIILTTVELSFSWDANTTTKGLGTFSTFKAFVVPTLSILFSIGNLCFSNCDTLAACFTIACKRFFITCDATWVCVYKNILLVVKGSITLHTCEMTFMVVSTICTKIVFFKDCLVTTFAPWLETIVIISTTYKDVIFLKIKAQQFSKRLITHFAFKTRISMENGKIAGLVTNKLRGYTHIANVKKFVAMEAFSRFIENNYRPTIRVVCHLFFHKSVEFSMAFLC
eukprot:m.38764 g.38764  ORF g.38764 m.38764 type:complete len:318 (-) comp6816_c0_seq5:297-1250(-)